MDLSQAYRKAVEENLPGAAIVFDRFHVIKLYNEKLSELLHVRLAKDGDVVEQELPLDGFPSPEDLWQRLCAKKNHTPSEFDLLSSLDWL